MRECLNPLKSLLYTLAVVAFHTVVAQVEGDYCGQDTPISWTHLRIGGDGEFLIEDYLKVHGEVLETRKMGHYEVVGDTIMFELESGAGRASGDGGKYIGYWEGKKLYYGKGPYRSLKKCSTRKLLRVKERFEKTTGS